MIQIGDHFSIHPNNIDTVELIDEVRGTPSDDKPDTWTAQVEISYHRVSSGYTKTLTFTGLREGDAKEKAIQAYVEILKNWSFWSRYSTAGK